MSLTAYETTYMVFSGVKFYTIQYTTEDGSGEAQEVVLSSWDDLKTIVGTDGAIQLAVSEPGQQVRILLSYLYVLGLLCTSFMGFLVYPVWFACYNNFLIVFLRKAMFNGSVNPGKNTVQHTHRVK